MIAATAIAVLTPERVATAAQANCQSGIPVVGDVDGDGKSDLIVGVPGRASNTGEVDLRLTTAPSDLLTQQAAGLGQGIAGDQFGAAVVLADLNADGCDDIIVGAPGASNRAGRVHIVLGAEHGFQTTDGQTLNGGAASGDRFGSSLAIAQNRAGSGFDLWIGVPLDNVGSAADAGSVVHYSITNSGGNLAFNLVQSVQIVAGVPGEDITASGSARVDAGTVAFFTPPPFQPCAGSVDQANRLSRTPESGDRLGSTLALGRHSDDNASASDRAFIGVPGEDSAAGIVQSTPIGGDADSTGIIVAEELKSWVGYTRGDIPGTNYGAVIASPAGE